MPAQFLGGCACGAIRAGSLDDPSIFRPAQDIYTAALNHGTT